MSFVDLVGIVVMMVMMIQRLSDLVGEGRLVVRQRGNAGLALMCLIAVLMVGQLVVKLGLGTRLSERLGVLMEVMVVVEKEEKMEEEEERLISCWLWEIL